MMSANFATRFKGGTADDHNAVLTLVLIDSICVVAGFLTDSFLHVRQFGLDYPLIVHLHAVTFSSWLVLFNVQVWLVRKDRKDLHRRLAKAAFWLAGFMIVLGPATALTVDPTLVPAGTPPVMLSVQLTDMVAFGGLTFAAVSLRTNPAAHKRLMLMGLFYLSDAGFARLVNGLLAAPLGTSPLATPVGLYAGTNLMALALGTYDLWRYRRLHPAYVAAVIWIVLLQSTALYLLADPAWANVVQGIYSI